MEIKISQLAELINGKIDGDPNLIITNLAGIDEARNGDLTFLYMSVYEKYFTPLL